MLDGYVARKTNTATETGAKLDSIADFLMFFIVIVIYFPRVSSVEWLFKWIVIIGIFKGISVVVIFIKYKTFGMLHTYANKVTGALIFLFPLLLWFVSLSVVVSIICFVASISAFEELIINLCSSELQLNRKSIFIK